MPLEWEQVIVDAEDPARLGQWWAAALDWIVVDDDPEEFEIRPAPDRLPGLLFISVPEKKTLKYRLHLDFRPDDQQAEVDRLLGLGATRANIGQGDEKWVVLADPEGTEEAAEARRARRDVYLEASINGMYLGSMTLDPIPGSIEAAEPGRIEDELQGRLGPAPRRVRPQPSVEQL